MNEGIRVSFHKRSFGRGMPENRVSFQGYVGTCFEIYFTPSLLCGWMNLAGVETKDISPSVHLLPHLLGGSWHVWNSPNMWVTVINKASTWHQRYVFSIRMLFAHANVVCIHSTIRPPTQKSYANFWKKHPKTYKIVTYCKAVPTKTDLMQF